MTLKTVTLGAYTVDDHAAGLNAAQVTLTQRQLAHLWRLAYLVKRYRLAAVHEYDPSPVWGDDDECEPDATFVPDETIENSIDGVRLIVTDSAFYYAGYLRHSSIEIETRSVDLKDIGQPPPVLRLRLTLIDAIHRIQQMMHSFCLQHARRRLVQS